MQIHVFLLLFQAVDVCAAVHVSRGSDADTISIKVWCVWETDAGYPVFEFSVQNTDKYTSTKYPPHSMLLVLVVWLPTDT